MIKRITGRGLVVHQNQILLMERWRDGVHYFSIPGGGVESGETIEQAAVRELMEEMGIAVTIRHKVFQIEDNGCQHHIFLCDFHGGEPRLLPDSPEALFQHENNRFKPRWIRLDDLDKLPFAYWQPLKADLVLSSQDNFRGPCKTITF